VLSIGVLSTDLSVRVRLAACCGGWILITWCLARKLRAALGLAFMRFVGIRCEGPADVT
jgi:hypothetical protein